MTHLNSFSNKVRIFYESVVRVSRWFPVIWKDRDYDHWFVYEILITKLNFQAETLKKNGLIEFDRDYERIQTIIRILKKAQGEDYIDDVIEDLPLGKISKKDVEHGYAQHEKAKKLAFKMIANYIDFWWD